MPSLGFVVGRHRFAQLLSEQSRGSGEKIVRGENPNQSSIVNDGQASDAIALHYLQSV